MVKYDSNIRNELDWLLREYEKLRSMSSELQRDDILMFLCSKILAKEEEDFQYNKLSDSEKKHYDFYKTQHPEWNHKQVLVRIALDKSWCDYSE